MGAYTIYQNFDFSGGLNTREKVAEISSNECTVSQNWVSSGKAIEVLPGYVKFNDVPVEECASLPVKTMFRFVKPSDPGIKRFLMHCGTAVWVADEVSKEWIKLIPSLTPDSRLSWTVYGDQYCYIVTESDGLRKYNGTSVYFIGDAPSGTTVSAHYNRLIIGGGKNHPNRLFWSEAGFADIWDTANNYQEIPTVKGDGITRTAFFLDGTLIFKHQSIWRISGNMDPFPLSVVSDSIGCTALESVVVYGDKVFFFSNTRHIYCYDGLNLINLTEEKIGALPVSPANAGNVCGAVIDGKLWVSYCDADSNDIYNNRALICDISSTANPKWFGPHTGFRIASFCSFDGHNDTGDIYFGDANTATVWRKGTNFYHGASLYGTTLSADEDSIQVVSTLPVAENTLAGCAIRISGGSGVGQERIVSGNTEFSFDGDFYSGTIQIYRTWDTIPFTDSIWEIGTIDARYRTGVLSMEAPERQKIFDKVFVHTESEGDYPLVVEIIKNHMDGGNQYIYSLLGDTAVWDTAVFDESAFASPDMLDDYIDLDCEEAKYLNIEFSINGRDQPSILYGYILFFTYGDMLNFNGS
ncbi:MAG: hypothetical protein C4541_09170 [Candidatus Auribacter fodinae]|jgi:hypothetical protein|uniref:Uncharacterized protein n=1 Tax=Candidatus Auribacter fodinae TaxID=2093366 RepID=A0A3A4QVC3_9BACT|nr:MAG: hypothetical protein C4541_09170 [Candidatus Auribacter fodinae]